MKKGFVVGITSVLMFASASQALASFEDSKFIMSIYTGTKEIGIDLGEITDFTAKNVPLRDNVSIKYLMNAGTVNAQIGLFRDLSTGTASSSYKGGYFGFNTSDPSGLSLSSGGTSNFFTKGNAIQNNYASNVGANGYTAEVGVVDGTYNTYAVGYNNNLQTDSSYGGLNIVPGFEGFLEAEYTKVGNQYPDTYPVNSPYVDMYLYQWEYSAIPGSGSTTKRVHLIQDVPVASFRLDAVAGTITMNYTEANPVPVPGAAWLLGAGLMGLAGLSRNRKN